MQKLLVVAFFLAMTTLVVACSDEDDNNEVKEAPNDKEQVQKEQTVASIPREELVDAFLNEEYEQIYEQASGEFKKGISLKQLEQVGEQFQEDSEDFSLEVEMDFNDLTRLVWTDADETKGMMATVDESDIIVGLQVLFFESHPETDKTLTENTFIYPFEDEWLVFWGGRNQLINYHYAQTNQRYAYDFIKVKDDSSYSGKADDNESYYSFGEKVIAPADGTVVDVKNDIEDNIPGEMNQFVPAGNYVIIDHGHDEYSLIAHFKEDSIIVEKGDAVKQGDELGLVGNSGNSSEPHIHFQVMDQASFEEGKSIRIQLENEADPVQGDIVE